MHKKLLIDAYKKAEKEEGLKKKTHVTLFLSDYIVEDSGEPYGEKILRIHYNNAIANTNEKVELKNFAAKSLCNYLGYIAFSDYDTSESVTLVNSKVNFFIKHKIKLLLVIALILGTLLITSFTIENQKWMVWKTNHYEEVSFNIEKYNINDFKIYNEDRINYFKKVKPTCSTTYFTRKGNEKLWYGKNSQKVLEFFSALGLHPETGKTLKPITEYMIKKYICEDFNKN